MELQDSQLEDARHKFMTGDGRFNWILFCNEVEKARRGAWSEASRIKHAQLFQSMTPIGEDWPWNNKLSEANISMPPWDGPSGLIPQKASENARNAKR